MTTSYPSSKIRRLGGLLMVVGGLAISSFAALALSACQHRESDGDRATKADPADKAVPAKVGDDDSDARAGHDERAEDKGKDDDKADKRSDDSQQGDITVSTTPDGRTMLYLSDDAIHRADLTIAKLAAATGGPQTVAYGTFIADPAHTFMLRAPVAGTVEALPGTWPELGSIVKSGAQMVGLAPILAAAERVNLSAQLATARGQVTADQAQLAAAQAAFVRAKTLNSENKNISDSALQEARATRDADAARLRADRQQVQLLSASLSGRSGGGDLQVLKSPASGEITQLLVSPGESVQAGMPLMQVSDFSSLVAKVEIPVGEPEPALSAPAQIVPAANSGLVLTGKPLGLGDDPNWQGEVRLYRVAAAKGALRPGMALAAYLREPAGSGSGVVIPRSAIVYTQSEAWAYLERDDGEFVRQPVDTDQPAPGGYYVSGPWKPGDRVVIEGEQALLSQEQQSGLSGGDGNDKGKKKDGGDGGDDLDG